MAKLRLTALEGQHQGEALDAQFSPTEIVVDHEVVWQPQLHKGPGDLEFEQLGPARMRFTLLFDEAESSSSVQPQLDKLYLLSAVDAVLHRPPKVEVTWGKGAGTMPVFKSVIESVSVRYTMFAENGRPVRATADVALRGAEHLRAHA